MSEKKTEMVTNRRNLLKLAAVTGISMAVQTSATASQKTETDSPKDNGGALPHRVLGKGEAAFEVSALGFDVMGMTYNRSQHPDKKACIRLLHDAVEHGVTLFDTAIIYGPLNNEELAGEALGSLRNRINVTTKFGHEVIDGKATGRQDSRPATIRRYCEESLKRLRLEPFRSSTNIALTRTLRWKMWQALWLI